MGILRQNYRGGGLGVEGRGTYGSMYGMGRGAETYRPLDYTLLWPCKALG